MSLKNAPFYYTGTPTPSCDSHSCQDTITSATTPYSDSSLEVGL